MILLHLKNLPNDLFSLRWNEGERKNYNHFCESFESFLNSPHIFLAHTREMWILKKKTFGSRIGIRWMVKLEKKRCTILIRDTKNWDVIPWAWSYQPMRNEQIWTVLIRGCLQFADALIMKTLNSSRWFFIYRTVVNTWWLNKGFFILYLLLPYDFY